MSVSVASMTARERYLETLLFGSPDKIPFVPGGPRESTRKKWKEQGQDPETPWRRELYEILGLAPEPTRSIVPPRVNFRMMPQFEEKVLEHANGHYIVQDWMGNVVEISDEYDYTYIRNAIDFVTRKWHKFPVETRSDFAEMKRRYEPDTPGRFPEDFKARCVQMRARDFVSGVQISGPFWQLREWCGFEPLCMLFVEDPEFIHEMCTFWSEFVSRMLAPMFEAGMVDRLGISEDMAYKEKPMISPAMTREFIQPCYDRWVSEARQAGVPIIDLDSDGRVDTLIPLWIESGINVCSPMEVAAGTDLVDLRTRFGRDMAYRQGVDKRCIAQGGEVIDAELARLAPVIRDGGYIPGCDHGVPPDISWPNFIHYSRRLAELTGWL